MKEFAFKIGTKNGMEQVRIENSGPLFQVNLSGEDMGTIFRDEEIGSEWNSFDEVLKSYIPDMASVFSELLAVQDFPNVLMLCFSDVIHARWNKFSQLEVLLQDEADLKYFFYCLDISLPSMVSFSSTIKLRIRKKLASNAVLYTINGEKSHNHIYKQSKKTIIMKNPEEEQNIDDRDINESEDQESQKDIHSNGFEPVANLDTQTDIDILSQSYKASESSFTLNLD